MTIYAHFQDKDNLIAEVLRTYLFGRLSEFEAIAGGPGGFLDRLGRIVAEKVLISEEFQGELFATLHSSAPGLATEVQEYRTRLFRTVTSKLFDEGRHEGLMDPAIGNETILLFWDVIRAGMLASPAFKEAARENPKLLSEINRIVLNGIISTVNR